MTDSAQTSATIRAGWMIQSRAHGLMMAESLGLQLSLPVNGHDCVLMVEVAERPVSQPLKLDLPLYVVRGYDTLARADAVCGAGENEAPGSWLVVSITRKFTVSPDLAERFQADPDGTIAEVQASLELAAQEELRSIAGLATGVLALELMNSRPSLWNEGAISWHDENQYKASSKSSIAEMLTASQLTPAQLLTLARQVGATAATTVRTRKVLGLCFRWLLVAHRLPHGSNERFVTIFQCLEALCTLVGNDPTEADAAGFALLDTLATVAAPEQVKSAREFLQRIKERLLKPSLAERFARLAQRYSASTADDDLRAFRAVRDARNDLLHARLVEISGLRDGIGPHEAAHELAVRYLAAVVSDETRRTKHELIVKSARHDASS